MRKTVRNIEALILSVGMAMSLAACGGNPSEGSADSQTEAGGEVEGIDLTGETGGAPEGYSAELDGAQGGNGGLRLLSMENEEGCHTEDGYYYLEKEAKELSDGNRGCHLMYMDFDTLQEVYLCSNAGCNHDSVDCSSVFLYEEFMPYTTLIFPYQGSLYLFSKAQDHDGSMQTTFGMEDITMGEAEAEPSILYRANLDGTDREKVYTFDASITVEDYVIGDENGLYLVTKKLTSQEDGASTYVHSEKRELVFLDLEKGETSEVCSMNFGGNISWKVAGCYDRTLVLQGIDYGRAVSDEELFSDDDYPDLHKNSSQVFAELNLDSGQMTEKYRISNKEQNSFLLSGSALYCSLEEEGSIKEIDLKTGGERSVYSEPGKYYYLSRIMGDKLCCCNFSGGGGDRTYYYIDRNTGEMSHSGLVNKTLGWSLEFKAVLDRDVLVVYDYEATPVGGDTYNITLYQHGLISQEDLFAGNDNFRKINMIGTGW